MTAVSRSITVACPRELAFRVFTERMASWWPLATHHIGAVPAATVVIEPRLGGRWFERGTDGSECPWGRVLAWEPPTRLALAWQISADWAYDATLETTIEVRFEALDAATTQVHLEHRGLEAYGGRAAEMVAIFESAGAWTGMLEAFAGAARS
ncbi:MAG: SRPBCC family protein [Myxococcales bacterium]|nr:SRPBCC family protein [Myxococcales bacterium]